MASGCGGRLQRGYALTSKVVDIYVKASWPQRDCCVVTLPCSEAGGARHVTHCLMLASFHADVIERLTTPCMTTLRYVTAGYRPAPQWSVQKTIIHSNTLFTRRSKHEANLEHTFASSLLHHVDVVVVCVFLQNYLQCLYEMFALCTQTCLELCIPAYDALFNVAPNV